jgi:hypothetical protein
MFHSRATLMSDTQIFSPPPRGAFDRARAKRTCFTPFALHSALIARRTASLSHFSTTDEDINLETRPERIAMQFYVGFVRLFC